MDPRLLSRCSLHIIFYSIRKNTAPDSTIVHSVQEFHLLTDYSFYVLCCSLTVAYYRHICPSALSVKNYIEYGTFCQLTIWTILFLCYPFSDNVHFHTYDLCYFFYLHSFFQKSLSDIMCFLHFAFFPAFYSSFFQTCSHGTLPRTAGESFRLLIIPVR